MPPLLFSYLFVSLFIHVLDRWKTILQLPHTYGFPHTLLPIIAPFISTYTHLLTTMPGRVHDGLLSVSRTMACWSFCTREGAGSVSRCFHLRTSVCLPRRFFCLCSQAVIYTNFLPSVLPGGGLEGCLAAGGTFLPGSSIYVCSFSVCLHRICVCLFFLLYLLALCALRQLWHSFFFFALGRPSAGVSANTFSRDPPSFYHSMVHPYPSSGLSVWRQLTYAALAVSYDIQSLTIGRGQP